MKSHLRSVAKRKVSDFLLREEGMVGNRSAFATAALVSTTAIAMTLLVAPDATAGLCGENPCNLDCCCTVDWVDYGCFNIDPGHPWECWAP
jgi:hypothetical protein